MVELNNGVLNESSLDDTLDSNLEETTPFNMSHGIIRVPKDNEPNAFGLYLSRIGQFKLLDATQEREYGKYIKEAYSRADEVVKRILTIVERERNPDYEDAILRIRIVLTPRKVSKDKNNKEEHEVQRSKAARYLRNLLSGELEDSEVLGILSRAKYRDLLQQANVHYEEGEKWKEKLVVANLRLVVYVAKKYQGRGLAIDDLIQEGAFGLMRAAELYDYRRKGTRPDGRSGYLKFSTYASTWIKQSIIRAIHDKGGTIRIPVHLGEDVQKLGKAEAKYAVKHNGKKPTLQELSKLSKLSFAGLNKAFAARKQSDVFSLDVVVDSEDHTLAYYVPDESAGPEVNALKILSNERIVKTLERLLKKEEVEIIKMRFGFNDGEQYTLEEIGAMKNLSRERIRQITEAALKKLRRNGKDLAKLL